jgi:hypothetical protein
MKTPRFSSLLLVALLAGGWLVTGAQAALVGASGYTNDFSTPPAAADWATYGLAGGSGDITTSAALDATVQTVAAGSINTAVTADNTVDPAAALATATWSSIGAYLQTRPTGVGATLLMCTLVNDLGGQASRVDISYDFATNILAVEEVLGLRAYYSLTGVAGTWTVIPESSSATPGRLTANLALVWPPGGALYLLWADENGSGSPDTACQIDNFSAKATLATQVPVTITGQPADADVTELEPATFSVVAEGNPLPTYQWYKDKALIPSATAATYTIASVPLNYHNSAFFVVASNMVTNISHVVTSRVATLTVQPDLIAPTVRRLLPSAGITLPALTQIEVDFSEGVTGVDASDLQINGSPAASVNALAPDAYVFSFTPPGTGTVQVAWSASHGIKDLAANANPFTGSGFSYFITPSAPLGDVRITEFIASNTRTPPKDEDGQFTDWIELQNVGSTTVNLNGWYLTDSTGNLRKWMFPSTNMGPGQFLVVFASGKNKRIPGAPLHTSFRLSSSPGYLALVQPDGQTIASQFGPSYLQQFADVSFGLGIVQNTFTLLPTNASVRALVPADGSLGEDWKQPGFDDHAWISGTNGVGYDTGGINPGEDTVASIVLNSGPVGYWRLDETSGTTAANLVAGGASATYGGSPTLGVAGPRPPAFGGFEANNNAVQFNGSSAYAGGPVSLLNNLGAFTIAGWVNAAAAPGSRIGLFGQNDCVEFGFINGTTLECWTPSGGSLDAAYTPVLGTWFHVVAVGNGSTIRIFVNGLLIGTGGSATTSYGSSTYNFNIGGNGIFDTTGNFFNGKIDEVAVWTRALSADEILAQYQAAITPTATASYNNLIGTNVRAAMFGQNSSCYIRYLFNVDNPAEVDQMKLRMNYDDGFAAYLNGNLVAWRNSPSTLAWNSAATTYNPDGAALLGENLNITGSIGSLRVGTNVLAIQGLNTYTTNADFLVYAELTAISVGNYDTNTPRYFTVPTPGNFNGAGTADLGPVISDLQRLPAPPRPLTTNDPITVTARVQGSFAAVTNVTLYWRVMWGGTNSVEMLDDGAHGDGAAGDGVFGATIPSGVATNGQMVRWFIRAWDTGGLSSRWPIFANPTINPEYEGTMIEDPSVSSQLQVWQFFFQPGSPSFTGIDTESGGRGSMYYGGEFYDNIYMELRGNTTASYPKKSHRIEFNPDRPLKNAVPGWEFRHTSLLSETADPAYLRTFLSFWLLDLMGVPAPADYPVHCRRNGQFWGLWFFNDVLGAEQLERLGYDPLGALYKAAGTVQTSHSSTGGFEKKTRLWEDTSDFDAMATAIAESNSVTNRKAYIFDNLNLPEIVNYLATARWTQEGDDVWANMTLYRDTLGTKEWFIVPFDLNVSWGQLYCGDVGSVFVNMVATNDIYKGHPLYGGSAVQQAGGSSWNRIYDVIVTVPETRQMLLRRERTLLEKFAGPPGTPFGQGVMEQQIAYMTNLMWPEMFADRVSNGWPCTTLGTACGMYCWAQAWPTNEHYGVPGLMNEFIYPRRVHWWATHSITNTAKPIGVGQTLNAGIPETLPGAFLQVFSLDYNPASGNQAQEYVCLTNPTPFALDISGWALDGAVRFTFSPGTIVPSNSLIYVSPDVAAFRSRTSSPKAGEGNFVVGPYQGQLSARGETIVVKNDLGLLVSSKAYAGNPTPAQQYLRITEVMYHPAGAVGDAYLADEFEYIEFKNISPSVTLDLHGVKLNNGIVFDFTGSAATNLGPGQTVLLVKNTNAFVARYGSGLPLAGQYAPYQLNNAGERLQLLDASGEEVLDFTYDNKWYPVTDGLGFSLVVVDEHAQTDAWSQASNWRPSGQVGGSPGATDPAPSPIVPVVISEILTRSETPPPTDSIELYNPTATSADLGGWFLTDDFTMPQKYRIPSGTILPPGCYVVFNESQFNPTPGLGNSFALGADGDEVYLFSGDAATNLTGYYHGFTFGAADNGVSFGRLVTTDGHEHFPAQIARTLGTNNAGPVVGPLVISEILYHPPEIGGLDNTIDEFIELLNISAGPVDLFDSASLTNTWRVTGGLDYVFPTNLTVAAGEFLLLVNFDPADASRLASFRSKYGVAPGVRVFGPYGGKLNNAGDNVELKKAITLPGNVAASVLVDKVNFLDSVPWPVAADGFGLSLQRKDLRAYGNEPANWIAALPTAGAPGPSAGQPPSIQGQPASQVVPANTSLTLGVNATGPGSLRYQWRFNGANIPEGTNATWFIPSFGVPNIGDYQAVVYNEFGAAATTNATLTLAASLVIMVQPHDLTVFARNSATFSVGAFTSGSISYQWRRDGTPISAATNSSYAIPNVEPGDAGEYTVLVSDGISPVLSTPAQLFVTAHPVFTLQPTNRSLALSTPSTNVTMVAAAASGTPVRYQWMFNTTNIPNATNATLQLSNVLYTSSGDYAVVATDGYGSVTSTNATLTVGIKPAFVSHPQPVTQTRQVGETATITVVASGSPAPGFRWRRATPSSPATTVVNPILDIQSVPTPTNLITTCTLTVPNVNYTNHLDAYGVILSNFVGQSSVSSNATLAVLFPPVVTTQPTNVVVNPSSNAVLQASFLGNPAVSYQWWFNSNTVVGGATDVIATNSKSPPIASVTVSNAQATNEGFYFVVLSNPQGSTTSLVATLTLRKPPVILADPLSQSVLQGGAATFNVGVTGTPPYAYRWRFYGSNVPSAAGTLATLTLTNIQAARQGEYSVVVTNPMGSVTSGVAFLTVIPDSDLDGTPDWWMLQYFGHTNGLASDHSRATDDADGDSMVNRDEYIAGTDPTNPGSYLRVEADRAVPGGMVLQFNAVSNRAYAVYYRDVAGDGAWTKLQDIAATATTRVISVTNAPGTPERYYRLYIPTSP